MSADDSGSSLPASKLRILIVEDDPDLRSQLYQWFADNLREAAVSVADRGESAMAQISVSAPDYIVMDIRLPGKNGLELTREIKSRHPDITVIINSQHDSAEYRSAAERVGADHFFSKRIDSIEKIGKIVNSD